MYRYEGMILVASSIACAAAIKQLPAMKGPRILRHRLNWDEQAKECVEGIQAEASHDYELF